MNKKRILISGCTLCLLLFGGYLIYINYFQKEEVPITVVNGDFLPAKKDARKISAREIKKSAQAEVDKSNFNMVIGSKAKIDKTTMAGNLFIQNPKHNAYPINVVISLNDTKQVVYTSGAIRPGEEIKHVSLEKKISSGQHLATAKFNLYDPNTQKHKGEVASGITFEVQ